MRGIGIQAEGIRGLQALQALQVVGRGRRKRTAEDQIKGIGRVFGSWGSRKGIWGHYHNEQGERQRTEEGRWEERCWKDQSDGVW